jgi:hypothetical protein
MKITPWALKCQKHACDEVMRDNDATASGTRFTTTIYQD